MVSAVSVSTSSPAVTRTDAGSRNSARPVITVTVSMVSSMLKFAPRSLAVSSRVASTAIRCCSPGAAAVRCSAWYTSDLVGTQPMLMQVPPYIWSDCSIIATRRPSRPSVAASVFPPLPNPMTRRSTAPAP